MRALMVLLSLVLLPGCSGIVDRIFGPDSEVCEEVLVGVEEVCEAVREGL